MMWKKAICNVVMSHDVLKSDKAPFIIYADLQCLIEKIDECKNNPETSSAKKIYSISFFNVYIIVI